MRYICPHCGNDSRNAERPLKEIYTVHMARNLSDAIPGYNPNESVLEENAVFEQDGKHMDFVSIFCTVCEHDNDQLKPVAETPDEEIALLFDELRAIVGDIKYVPNDPALRDKLKARAEDVQKRADDLTRRAAASLVSNP